MNTDHPDTTSTTQEESTVQTASSVVSFSSNRRATTERRNGERRSGIERRVFDFNTEAGLMLAGLGFAHTPAMDWFPWRYTHEKLGVVRAWPMGDRLVMRFDEPERAPEGFNVCPHTGRMPMRQKGEPTMDSIEAMRRKLESLLS